MDYLSDARFALFRAIAARFSEPFLKPQTQIGPTPELVRISKRLFDDFFEQDGENDLRQKAVRDLIWGFCGFRQLTG